MNGIASYRTKTGRALLALSVAGTGLAWVLVSRPVRAAGANVSASIIGPIGIQRGQTARLTALSTATLSGSPHSLDLKFVIRGENGWQIVQRSFNLNANQPAAGIQLRVEQDGSVWLIKTPGGALYSNPDQGGAGFEKLSLGSVPLGLVTIDICGHEITHGVKKGEVPTSSSFAVIDNQTQNTLQSLSMVKTEGRYY